jgi:hypothetical protein
VVSCIEQLTAIVPAIFSVAAASRGRATLAGRVNTHLAPRMKSWPGATRTALAARALAHARAGGIITEVRTKF